MAIAEPNCECLWGNVGSNGRNNNGGVWNKYGLLQGIEDGKIKLPENDSLSENHRNLPYVFFVKNAFALKTFMMKPYPQSDLTINKGIYNYPHSRARRISENYWLFWQIDGKSFTQ